MIARLALVLAVVAGSSSRLRAQTATALVTGTVRDELARPLERALVVIDPDSGAQQARTDAAGRFRIPISPGPHEIRVVRIGFAPYEARINVAPGGFDVAVTLNSVPIPLDTVAVRVSRSGLHGTVVTRGFNLQPHDPRPLRGATVEVVDTRLRATTASDGTFSINDLDDGAYSVVVRLDRYQSRLLPIYVPRDGGMDVTVVLDSTIADWQRRDDAELRDILSRVRWANYPSAFVSSLELAGPEGMTLHRALRLAPSTLSRGLLVRDDIACVYVNGNPAPGLTTSDILASEVHAVEVYGLPAKGRLPIPQRPWPAGSHCGTGTRQGPRATWSSTTLGRGGRRESDTFARVIVVWLHRR